MEDPDALIAFKEGGSGIAMFQEAGIPVDMFSVIWGGLITDILYNCTDAVGFAAGELGSRTDRGCGSCCRRSFHERARHH